MEENTMFLNILRSLFAITCCLFIFVPVAAADSHEWKDPAYNFEKVKKILITEPQFSYENINSSGSDRFKKYPNGTENISGMLHGRFEKLIKAKSVNLSYVENQVKVDPEIELPNEITAIEFSAVVDKELNKYVDLILSVEIHNYGWSHIYHDAYETTETKTETVRYGGRTPEGKEYSGWMEVPRTVTVYHNAGFTIYDNAQAKFSLIHPVSKKVVWTYSDTRDRLSVSWSKDYDPSGPESMMKRIFDNAFNKLPLTKKE